MKAIALWQAGWPRVEIEQWLEVVGYPIESDTIDQFQMVCIGIHAILSWYIEDGLKRVAVGKRAIDYAKTLDHIPMISAVNSRALIVDEKPFIFDGHENFDGDVVFMSHAFDAKGYYEFLCGF